MSSVGAFSIAFAEEVETNYVESIGRDYHLKEIDRKSDDKLPRALYQIDPVYPVELKKKGIEGWAQVEWVIDTNGIVRKPRVVKSSRWEFESPSLEAIKKSKWKPAIIDGSEVNVRVRQKMDFKVGTKVAVSRSKE